MLGKSRVLPFLAFLQVCFIDHMPYGHTSYAAAAVCHLKQALMPWKNILREAQEKCYVGISVNWILICSITTSVHLIFYLLFPGLVFW